MQPTCQRPLFWIHADEVAANQNPIDDESDETIFPAALGEIQTPAIISVICLVSTYLFESIFFQTCFVISSAHLSTKLVKKLFADYSFMSALAEQALTITRRTPYVYILIATIALLFAWHVPVVSVVASVSLGILSALAVDLYSQGVACDLEKKEGEGEGKGGDMR